MASTKKYFHDRFVLLLLSVNAFLTVLAVLTVLLRLQGGGEGFIVQYRANLGVSAFQPGDLSGILMFIVFAVVVLVVHSALSYKAYPIQRQLSLLVLALGTLLLGLSIIVSQALLALH
jgi:hypothetical protein